jgi:hypothetical protein
VEVARGMRIGPVHGSDERDANSTTTAAAKAGYA